MTEEFDAQTEINELKTKVEHINTYLGVLIEVACMCDVKLADEVEALKVRVEAIEDKA